MEEKVVLVDFDDSIQGESEKMHAHRNCLLHRAVSVFIFNTKMELLLQKRASCKYHSPKLWTNTACTHPQFAEHIADAAIRRLKEEMGLNVNEVTHLFEFVYKEKLDHDLWEYEYDHVYVGFSDQVPVINPDEVGEYKYIACNELLHSVETNPELYTVWFKKIIHRVVDEVSNLKSTAAC